MLCLQDARIADTLLLNDSLRQLVVIDACRNELPPAISGIPEMPPEYDYFTSSPARSKFDECIRTSPPGKLIVYGTAKGETSDDTPIGGMFTNALIGVSSVMTTSQGYMPISMGKLLQDAQRVLIARNSPQKLSIAFKTGNLTVPFVIAIPETDIPRSSPARAKPVAPNQTVSIDGWLAVLAAGAFIWLMTSSKRKK